MATKLNKKSERGEFLRHPEHLPRGSRILYVCDGTDGLENGGIINGVKRTQLSMEAELQRQGYQVDLLYPQKKDSRGQRMFATAQVPGYEGFEFAINPVATFQYIAETQPDAIFIATLEGPLGMTTAFACHNPLFIGRTDVVPYTVSFTTRLDKTLGDMVLQPLKGLSQNSPEWAKSMIDGFSIDPRIFHPWQRAIYNGAHRILVPTTTMMSELNDIGINVAEKGVLWPRGIDTELFHPPEENELPAYQHYEWYKKDPRPIALYFGRVAPEKNIDVFLSQDMPEFHQVIVGDGPYRSELEKRYPQAQFLGKKFGTELAELVRWADVHIFPSLTDTFGNTILEAGASGVSTIGFADVPGPQDIIRPGLNGFLIGESGELRTAAIAAANLNRQECSRDIVSRYSWTKASETLVYSMERTKLDQEKKNSTLR